MSYYDQHQQPPVGVPPPQGYPPKMHTLHQGTQLKGIRRGLRSSSVSSSVRSAASSPRDWFS
ncbi:hypothetical protein Patl1_28502 [Pistacia atlantica]|uniref:Uncharacterized protein n=1 Tax=Pistacia atlantica TaxID=434234 RepID=A0ACC1BGV8_9ROSI|nr:hypothetical protein Patl1_28502 [Pistacia atlantica]